MTAFALAILALILARCVAELWLSKLNQRHVRAHAEQVPTAFADMIDAFPTWLKPETGVIKAVVEVT